MEAELDLSSAHRFPIHTRGGRRYSTEPHQLFPISLSSPSLRAAPPSTNRRQTLDRLRAPDRSTPERRARTVVRVPLRELQVLPRRLCEGHRRQFWP